MNVNKCFLGGNLTRDVELKQLPNSDTVVAEFGMAVNENYGDKEYANFFECTAFGKLAENIAKFFKKGRPILVEGKLRYESWETQEGQKRSKVSIKVDNFHFVDSPPKNEDASVAAAPTPKPQTKAQPVKQGNQKVPF